MHLRVGRRVGQRVIGPAKCPYPAVPFVVRVASGWRKENGDEIPAADLRGRIRRRSRRRGVRREGALAAGGLRAPAEAKTVRVRRRQLMLSDGPFAETKEQIGGFCILE